MTLNDKLVDYVTQHSLSQVSAETKLIHTIRSDLLASAMMGKRHSIFYLRSTMFVHEMTANQILRALEKFSFEEEVEFSVGDDNNTITFFWDEE